MSDLKRVPDYVTVEPSMLPEGMHMDLAWHDFEIYDLSIDEAQALIDLLVERDELKAKLATPKDMPTRHDLLTSQRAADAFWIGWKRYGEPHKHGFYESTWIGFRMALDEAISNTGDENV